MYCRFWIRGFQGQVAKKDSAFTISLPEQGLDIESTLAVLEKSLLMQALRRTGGMKTSAAELLGLSLRTFRYRLQKYQLDDNESDGEVV